MTERTQRPWFFNLIKDGDTAVVRLLHSNVSTIERASTHKIEVDGKKKRVKCLGEGCPLCANGNSAQDRIYIHLYDYTDNTDKVWERTDKILPQLEELQKNWAPLNTAVIRITRKGDDFPKYTIEALNPMQYASVDNSLIDEKIARMFYLNRKQEEIVAFIKDGKFPERKPYLPKDEYEKLIASQKPNDNTLNDSVKVETVSTPDNSFDDPFMSDAFIKPRRV